MMETKQLFEQRMTQNDDNFPHLWNKRSSTPCNIRDLNSGIKTTVNN